MLSASVEVRVRYEETDKMGIVYHANYFTWFEIARIELLDAMGCPYRSLEQDGLYLPVLSCQADFHLPAHFDDRLRVDVEIADFPLVRITAGYKVFREDQLLVTGKTSHAFVSGEGKVVRPPEKFLGRARNFLEQDQDSD